MRTRKAVIGIAVGAYLVGMGVLAGTALERMRFDRHRLEVLRRFEDAVREHHMLRMTLEKHAEGRQP
jgi:hypothetical protein